MGQGWLAGAESPGGWVKKATSSGKCEPLSASGGQEGAAFTDGRCQTECDASAVGLYFNSRRVPLLRAGRWD